MTDPREDAAERAYAAYREGRALPDWSRLPDHRREVWRRVAAAVRTVETPPARRDAVAQRRNTA